MCNYILGNRANMGECSELDKLNHRFPLLSPENQSYVLGVAEGLSHAQERLEPPASADGAAKTNGKKEEEVRK